MGHHWPGADWPQTHEPERRPGGGRRAGGPPPWLTEMLGFASVATQAPPQRGGPKVRRGDVRTAIIDVLHRARTAEEPINGYQVIQEISELSNGEWRPSPGSVYPTIQQLQDEGLVEGDEERGRRTIRLSAEGTAWATEHADELAAVWAPFERPGARPEAAATAEGADIKSEIGQVMSAVWQLATQGSDQQRRAALGVLVETRRKLYGILADGRDGEAR